MSEERTIMHEGVEREFLVHIPDNLTEDSPIVFVIHGFTGSAKQIMEYSGMNAVADREVLVGEQQILAPPRHNRRAEHTHPDVRRIILAGQDQPRQKQDDE